MPAALECRMQECFEDFQCKPLADHARTHAQDVCVIVQARESGAVWLCAGCRTDAAVLVCGHAHADAGAAEQNALFRFAALYHCADLFGDDRIIAGGFIRSAVCKRDRMRLQVFCNGFPQPCRCVVASDRDHENSSLYEVKWCCQATVRLV